ncbi:thiamine pyrophosphate-dependent dehydrogenase E1 component subunit alpha [Amycolatopsis sp. NPDC059021]|uniref:thiamine pyrophosphate-dependent dehydrogenase E1 component subunit alpha n=1 Tax=Amycolatopsis sp. NPDC059021 TaxID=3346704 RepID=UPI00366CC580
MTGLLREAYRMMRTIRVFEQCVHDASARGELPGAERLHAGDEAAATGVCLHLDERDAIAGTQRGYGHCIAGGVDVKGMMAELYGRRTGSRRRGGGALHIADLARGMLGANGVLGGPSLICGTALAAKQQGTGGVGVAFFGDGASGDGATLEALHLATTWCLPVLFIAENTAWPRPSRGWSVASDSIADRAAAFGMPGEIVDGLDFFAVYEAAGEAIVRARNGGGPTLIEVRRFAIPPGCAYGGCLERFRGTVLDGGLEESILDRIDGEVAALVAASVAEAKAAPEPASADLETGA